MHFAIFHLRVQDIGHATHCRQLSNIWIASRFEMCSHRSHTPVHKHKQGNNGVDGGHRAVGVNHKYTLTLQS